MSPGAAMTELPVEVLSEILGFLEIEDLAACLDVCVLWRHVASQKSLWRTIRASELDTNLHPSGSALHWQLLSEARTLIIDGIDSPNEATIKQILHIQRSAPLTGFHLYENWALDREDLMHLVYVLPSTLEELTINSYLASSIMPTVRKLLETSGANMRKLDLSGTPLRAVDLNCIALFCNNLSHLSVSRMLYAQPTWLRTFLVVTAPETLKQLSISEPYVHPDWMADYISRQQRRFGSTRLEILDIQGCDIFTLRDVSKMRELTGDKCEIRHSAILADNTVEAYRNFIEMIYGQRMSSTTSLERSLELIEL